MLDGKYEIISEREVSSQSTLFNATAPDGTAVQITWFELQTPDDERAFERYRALLRALRRQGRAAIYDLVARPGAYYVAWQLPGEVRPAQTADEHEVLTTLRELLGAHGRHLSEAEVSTGPDGTPRIYMLPFRPLEAARVPSPARQNLESGPPATHTKNPTGTFRGGGGAFWYALWPTLYSALRPSLLGITLGLTGLLLLLLSFYRYTQTELIVVPDVRGEEINRAAETLHRLGFGVSTVALESEGAASEGRLGQVLELSPPVGTPLRPGRTLSVRYASRVDSASASQSVPDVRREALGDAEAILEAQGFSVSEVARVYADLPLGTVIAQTPAAGAIASGNSASLLVSNGPKGETTFLPELSGLSLDDALELAALAGFAPERVELEHVQGTGRPARTVLAQNLPPLVSVPQNGSRLRLTVAEGASVPRMGGGTPDLTGLTLSEAQRRARSLGLRAVREAQVSTLELPEGVVLQRPAPGSLTADPDLNLDPDTVQLTLNVHPRPLPRPNVRAEISRGEVRRATYTWLLEAGIPAQRATVTARTLLGEPQVVLRERAVAGGERLSGSWLTTAPGPITFSLTLNGLPYGDSVTVNP